MLKLQKLCGRAAALWRDRSIRLKGLFTVTLPLALMLAAIVPFYLLEMEEEAVAERAAHTVQLADETALLLRLLLEAQSSVRGYLLLGHDTLREDFRRASRELEATLADLTALEAEVHTEAGAHHELLETVSQLTTKTLARLQQQAASGRVTAAMALQTGRDIRALRRGVAQLQRLEARDLRAFEAREAALRTRQLRLIALAACLGVTSGLLAVWLFSASIVQRLRQVEANARRLTLRGPLEAFGGSDELARLNRSLLRASDLLREQEARLGLALRGSGTTLFQLHLERAELSLLQPPSPSAAHPPPDDIAAWHRLVHPEDLRRVHRAFEEATRTGVISDLEYRLVRPGGETQWWVMRAVRQANGTFLGASVDVTRQKRAEVAVQRANEALARANAELEQRVAARTTELARVNAQLQHDAFHDALTGLPNRALFFDRLGQGLERSARHPERRFAVLYLDFDRFKNVNDALGHAVGDALLIGVAGALQGCVGPADTVARLGGDEFAVLLDEVTGLSDALAVAERIHSAFVAPLQAAGHPIYTGVSIGVVLSDPSYRRSEDLVRDADIAMYGAKAQGGGRCAVFEAAMRERTQAMIALEADLRVAAELGQLEVHYQPIVNTTRAEVAGFEALVRWRHPQHGVVPPGEFIPLAEATGLIAELDRWVLVAACRQLQMWQAERPEHPLTLSVNLSAQDFQRPELVTFVGEVLDAVGMAPERLSLELTERVLADASEELNRTLKGLRALGVQLHIDDFGTGYSSLAYLQRFAAHALKVDRSFVAKVTEDEASAGLVRTVVEMARGLGMEVIVEGVETPEQLELLGGFGCEYMQGFLFSKPLSAAQARELILKSSGDPDASSSAVDPVSRPPRREESEAETAAF